MKHLQKICKDEIFNIETCAECFVKANTSRDSEWFTSVCSKPHLLIWAKLSGYPYWPAKVMGVFSNVLNVQFFGDHERAFVPSKDCFLYSQKDPNPVQPNTFRQQGFLNCVAEATEYIKNISIKFGHFNYAGLKTPLSSRLSTGELEKYVVKMIKSSAIFPTMPQTLTGGDSAIVSIPISCEDTPNSAGVPSMFRLNEVPKAREEAKRKNYERIKRSKYAKIISNPGNVVLDRIDLTIEPQPPSHPTALEAPQLNSDVPTSSITSSNVTAMKPGKDAFHRNIDLVSVQETVSLPLSTVADTNKAHNTSFDSTSFLPITSIISTNPVETSPQPSTSAQAVSDQKIISLNALELHHTNNTTLHSPPDADTQHQGNHIMGIVERLPALIVSTREKMNSLQSDWDTMSNFATEIIKWTANLDRTKIDQNKPLCINCGKDEKLFCSWTTGYCNYPCREQHR